MTTFDDRERAFEAKFAHDDELQFRVNARRDKLVGLWAAGKLGLNGDAAAEYAASIVREDFKEPGDEDVIAKLVADLPGVSEGDIRAQLLMAGTEALKQLAAAEVA